MADSSPTRGRLFLVVGPSGVGKDSVIEGLRRRLRGNGRFAFPRRYITRANVPGHETHHAVSSEQFAAMRAAGRFVLSWHAHGCDYGIGVEAASALADGVNVLVNASRGVLDHARSNLAPVQVIAISAREETLRQRLEARGREADDAIARRLARARAFDLSGDDVLHVANDGALNATVTRVLAAVNGERHYA